MNIQNSISRVALCAVLGLSGAAFAADVNNGNALYQQHCTNCHGDGGMGMMPGVPDFSRGERLFAPDMQLADAIRNGVRVMPAFEGLLSDHEILDVVAYLRTLQQ